MIDPNKDNSEHYLTNDFYDGGSLILNPSTSYKDDLSMIGEDKDSSQKESSFGLNTIEVRQNINYKNSSDDVDYFKEFTSGESGED